MESVLFQHNNLLGNDSKLADEVLQVESVASEYQMKCWSSIKRLKQFISKLSSLESVHHSQRLAQVEMEELEMIAGFEKMEEDDSSIFFVNEAEENNQSGFKKNIIQERIERINFEVNAKSDQIKHRYETMDKMLQAEKEAMDTKKQNILKKKMIDELEEKLRQAIREETEFVEK